LQANSSYFLPLLSRATGVTSWVSGLVKFGAVAVI